MAASPRAKIYSLSPKDPQTQKSPDPLDRGFFVRFGELIYHPNLLAVEAIKNAA